MVSSVDSLQLAAISDAEMYSVYKEKPGDFPVNFTGVLASCYSFFLNTSCYSFHFPPTLLFHASAVDCTTGGSLYSGYCLIINVLLNT